MMEEEVVSGEKGAVQHKVVNSTRRSSSLVLRGEIRSQQQQQQQQQQPCSKLGCSTKLDVATKRGGGGQIAGSKTNLQKAKSLRSSICSSYSSSKKNSYDIISNHHHHQRNETTQKKTDSSESSSSSGGGLGVALVTALPPGKLQKRGNNEFVSGETSSTSGLDNASFKKSMMMMSGKSKSTSISADSSSITRRSLPRGQQPTTTVNANGDRQYNNNNNNNSSSSSSLGIPKRNNDAIPSSSSINKRKDTVKRRSFEEEEKEGETSSGSSSSSSASTCFSSSSSSCRGKKIERPILVQGGKPNLGSERAAEFRRPRSTGVSEKIGGGGGGGLMMQSTRKSNHNSNRSFLQGSGGAIRRPNHEQGNNNSYNTTDPPTSRQLSSSSSESNNILRRRLFVSSTSRNRARTVSNSDVSQGAVRPTSPQQEGPRSWDTFQHYSIGGIAEMLAAFERIERDDVEDGFDYEQLLEMETSLLLGGLGNFDQHRDMRMDIDNMSYEELLALEERMGTVSTALTEEALSQCLKTDTYQQWPPCRDTTTTDMGKKKKKTDTKCSICQEEYACGDKIGRLLCEHMYHADCINQWLRLKNWCPICKAPAVAN